MKNSSDGKKPLNGAVSRSGKSPFRTLSGYLRIVSSGASNVAKSALSVASSIVERDDDSSNDQVLWAGFDKLEGERDVARQILLLGYRSGFQVWDVEEADNVRDLVSRYDGPVSFMQMLPRPVPSKRSLDKFADVRPLLVVCSDGSLSGGTNTQDGFSSTRNGTVSNYNDSGNGNFGPGIVRFYSVRSQSYVHMLKFRSVIYSVRCSARVIAICQAAQIHCFDATTLEREYTILTNPIGPGYPSSGGIGYGPLAVGPRWLAYSGSPVSVPDTGRVSPQHLTPSQSFPGFSSNGSLVAHYAKESSKQLAAGIVTLGDMGYKRLSRYCSELLPDSHSPQSAGPGLKLNGTVNGVSPEADNIGMVIVRDIVSKDVIAQFRAHKSPISALCFDPSGTLLVTASVQGHNINVFKIMPGYLGGSACDAGTSYVHLYRLQRGLTNAVIQDISFSEDSNWIMISSSRGTSHLFAINPSGGSVCFQSPDGGFASKKSSHGGMVKPGVRWPPSSGFLQQNLCASGPPVTLSVVSRIRNGTNGWRGSVTGAAAAATGRVTPLSGAIASSFHNCKGNNDTYAGGNSSKTRYHLVVFSPSGSMIQYELRVSAGVDATLGVSGLGNTYDSIAESDSRLVVQAIQKWNICQKQNRREREDNLDIYGENGTLDSNKIYPEEPSGGSWPLSDAGVKVEKMKANTEDRQHLYISEAEIQMHQVRIPLWAKPQIYFQSMMSEAIKLENQNDSQGELEIERIPVRMIEARSKDLVPVFNYVQSPKFQQSRFPAVDSNSNGQRLHQRSGLSDNGYSNGQLLPQRSGMSENGYSSGQILHQRSGVSENGYSNGQILHQRSVMSENGYHSRRSSSGSLDSVADSGCAAMAELTNGIDEFGFNVPRMPIETKGFVNNSDSPKSKNRLETVNNSESLRMEAQLKFVNNNIEGLKVENLFEDEGGEFD